MTRTAGLLLALAAALTGCAAAPVAGDDESPPAPVDHHGHLPAPAPRYAAVVFYYDRPDCSGGIFSFGLAAEGTHPEYAQDDWYTYPVLRTYEGGAYVMVGDECRIGGDYDGYDFFTLGAPTPK